MVKWNMEIYSKLNLTEFNLIKVSLSPSKKVGFICFNESPLRMMDNVFLSYLKNFFHS